MFQLKHMKKKKHWCGNRYSLSSIDFCINDLMDRKLKLNVVINNWMPLRLMNIYIRGKKIKYIYRGLDDNKIKHKLI